MSEYDSAMTNPYATALDGLDIPDPVAVFFNFCRERESVRHKREAGQAPPWSNDPIFQRGRFLNVFREDDRGTKAVLRFAEPAKSPLNHLVHALFFARWVNRPSSLDTIRFSDLGQPDHLRRVLLEKVPQPWNNPNAYPVEPICWTGQTYNSLEACTMLFPQIAEELSDLVLSGDKDVVAATNAVNARFGMTNNFPIFMAVIDIAWFRPDVIDPSSRVPTGIGAAPFLDRLQKHLGLPDHHATCARMIELQAELWPGAKRRFHPIDIEYLSCECRKYCSYVNGTKQFEGKNLYTPNER